MFASSNQFSTMQMIFLTIFYLQSLTLNNGPSKDSTANRIGILRHHKLVVVKLRTDALILLSPWQSRLFSLNFM